MNITRKLTNVWIFDHPRPMKVPLSLRYVIFVQQCSLFTWAIHLKYLIPVSLWFTKLWSDGRPYRGHQAGIEKLFSPQPNESWIKNQSSWNREIFECFLFFSSFFFFDGLCFCLLSRYVGRVTYESVWRVIRLLQYCNWSGLQGNVASCCLLMMMQ